MTERLQLDLETIPEAERARAADIEELANRLFAFADNVRDGVDLFDYCSAVTKHMLDERSQMIAEFKEKKEPGIRPPRTPESKVFLRKLSSWGILGCEAAIAALSNSLETLKTLGQKVRGCPSFVYSETGLEAVKTEFKRAFPNIKAIRHSVNHGVSPSPQDYASGSFDEGGVSISAQSYRFSRSVIGRTFTITRDKQVMKCEISRATVDSLVWLNNRARQEFERFERPSPFRAMNPGLPRL